MSYGEILKKKRIEKELTLDDIFTMTKIKKNYLIAFEEENYSAMPNEPFSFGFFKNYLSCLEIKDLSLLDEYKDKQKEFLKKTNEEIPLEHKKTKKELHYDIQVDMEKVPIFTKKKNTFLFMIIFLILFCSIIYIKFLSENIKKNINLDFLSINQDLLTKKEYKHIFELNMVSPEACWVVVKNNNTTLFNGLLKKNVNNTWLSFDGFEVFIGNKTNLKITLNNKKLNIHNYKSNDKIIINEDSLKNSELFI